MLLPPSPHGDPWLAAVPGGAGGEAGLQPPVQVAVVEAGARGHQARAVEDSAVPVITSAADLLGLLLAEGTYTSGALNRS